MKPRKMQMCLLQHNALCCTLKTSYVSIDDMYLKVLKCSTIWKCCSVSSCLKVASNHINIGRSFIDSLYVEQFDLVAIDSHLVPTSTSFYC